MKNYLAFGVAFIVLGFFGAEIRAQSGAKTEKPAWVTETSHKCKVWNELYLENPLRNHYQLWWSGTCKNGYASGTGYLQWSVPDKYKPDTVPGLVRAQYDGPIVNGKINGKGKISSSQSISYTGEFVDNEPDGYGEESFPSGRRYVGDYSHGLRSGHGTQYYPDGDRMECEWENDVEKNGYFVYDWGTGAHFQGYLADGVVSGHGLLIDKSGSKHEGEWKDGELIIGDTVYTLSTIADGDR